MKSSHSVFGKRLLIWGLTASALIATSTINADTVVYKITDRLGNVTYTDVAPKKSNKAVVVKTITIVYPDFGTDHASITPARAYPPIERADETFRNYDKIAIVSPYDDETVRANNGNIVLRAALVPRLRPGHKLRFYLGDRPVGIVSGDRLALANVNRGTHYLRVDVLDENREVLKSSNNTIFHLRRSSALSPTRKPQASPPALKK
jgi:hypothetical protein